MSEELKSEIRKIAIESYERGKRDAMDSAIAAFAAVKRTGKQTLTVDEIMQLLEAANIPNTADVGRAGDNLKKQSQP